MSEAQHAANQAENLWVQRVVEAMQAQTTNLKAKLTPGNAEGVLLKMVAFVVSKLETLVSTKKFNQLGGLQLDRDIRSLRDFFIQAASSSVRDKFTRLTQIANILTVEQPHEVLQYWDG